MPDDDATLRIELPSPGERLAQYQLLRQVGEGAMGVVHEALDLDLERRVAIKLLHDDLPGRPDPLAAERFLREARTAARLTHPHVAAVHQVGRDGDRLFIVMEWLDGGDLGQAIKQGGPLPWQEAAAAVRDAALGLAAAHAEGLVHRDVKPSNLMRHRSGAVKLVDFGLARLHEAPSDLTMTGNILGTPAYLAPEVCRGDPATPLADQYALGCTLFHLLAGHPPFPGPQLAVVLQAHLQTPLPDLRAQRAGLPEALCRIAERAGAKAPSERFVDVAAMARALQAVLDAADPGQTTLPILPSVPSVPVLAALDAAEPAPGVEHLPLEANAFIGRDTEVARLRSTLRQQRWVTLTGPGGTGKTRLALQVAALARRDECPDGVVCVELAALAAGQPVAAAVAAALGLREVGGTPVDALIEQHLAARQQLLLLDNAEHVIDGVRTLAERLHRGCPSLQLLVTSRLALGCSGEQAFAVPPLSVGNDDDGSDSEAPSDALRLFAERAASARPGFQLTADTRPAVQQICRRLDGIPLAIELAAARVRVLSTTQIAQRLGDVFQLLAGGPRHRLPRQQTLRALIDWSWELLDAPQRRLQARCSVFAGHFTIEAAEAVLASDEGERAAVLDGLADLVDHSMLVATETEGTMQYRLLQVLRDHAAEKLRADAGTDLDALQHRHARFHAEAVRQAVARLDGPEHAAGVRQVAGLQDNARAALDTALAQRWWDLALPLGADLAKYWLVQGVLGEGVARLEQALSASPPEDGELATWIGRGGALALYLGRADLARIWLHRGLAIARRLQRADVEGRTLNLLGMLARSDGDLAGAETFVVQAMQVWQGTGDRWAEAIALNNLGSLAQEQGQVDRARQWLEQSLAAFRGVGVARGIGHAALSLGDFEQLNGRPAVAQTHYESCRELLAGMDDAWSLAKVDTGLGRCALDLGDLPRAARQLERALQVTRRLGDRAAAAEQLDLLAHVALQDGRPDDARSLARESLALRLALDQRADLAATLETQAALASRDDPAAAARLLGAADALRQQLRAPRSAPRQALMAATEQALRERLDPATVDAERAAGAAQDPRDIARAAALR